MKLPHQHPPKSFCSKRPFFLGLMLRKTCSANSSKHLLGVNRCRGNPPAAELAAPAIAQCHSPGLGLCNREPRTLSRIPQSLDPPVDFLGSLVEWIILGRNRIIVTAAIGCWPLYDFHGLDFLVKERCLQWQHKIGRILNGLKNCKNYKWTIIEFCFFFSGRICRFFSMFFSHDIWGIPVNFPKTKPFMDEHGWNIIAKMGWPTPFKMEPFNLWYHVPCLDERAKAASHPKIISKVRHHVTDR